MAERVEIRGGELDGSVLDNAATEATLLRLVESFEKKNGTGSGSRIQDAYNKSLVSSTKNSTSLGKSFEETAKHSDSLGDTFEKTRSAASKLAGGFMGIVSSGIGTIISGASFAVQSFTDFLTSSFTNYREISNVGATFGNDMIEVSRNALNAGMSMSDFTDMIKQNSDVLMSLGGSASSGAQRLAELRDGIINSDLANRFYGLGLTTKDIENFMGGYLTQQQRLGSLQRRSDRDLREGTRLYIEELDKVTKLTGIQRKSLDEQAKRIALDPIFNQLRRGLNPEQLAKSTANLAMVAEIGGTELETAMKELATGVIQSPLAQELAATGAITKEAALAIAKGTADAGPILQNAYRKLMASGRYADAALLLANENLAAGASMRDQLARLQDAGFRESQEQQAQRNKLTEAFGKIPAVFDNIRNKIFGAIISSNVFDKMLTVLENAAVKLEEYLTPLIGYFGKLFEDLSGIANDPNQGIMAALKEGIKRLMSDFRTYVVPEFSKIMKELFGTDDIMQSVKNLVFDGFKTLVEVAIEGIGSVISSMLGFGETAPTIGTTAGTAAREPGEIRRGTAAREPAEIVSQTNTRSITDTNSALSNLLPTLERISTILGYGAVGTIGLIAAFTAFGVAANYAAPGMLALGAAIGMSGVGLGAAFWGLSKLADSVGTFLDKIDSFVKNITTYDSTKIKDTGLALGPLADNLIKLAGGGVLALFGSDGLVNLGTALEKIQSLDSTKISSINRPLEELNRVLSLFTGSGFIEGLGTFFSNLFVGDGGLGGFASAAAEFNKVDANNIKNIASGMESLKDSVITDFSAQTDSLKGFSESVKELTEDLKNLNEELANITSGAGLFGTGQSNLEVVAETLNRGGGTTVTNALIDEQRKLNTLIEELKPIFEETRDNTKNVADSVNGRRAIIER
jgi:hypothetical protein